jgi:hypothetical protein
MGRPGDFSLDLGIPNCGTPQVGVGSSSTWSFFWRGTVRAADGVVIPVAVRDEAADVSCSKMAHTASRPMKMAPRLSGWPMFYEGLWERGLAAGLPAVGLRAHGRPFHWFWRPHVRIWWGRCSGHNALLCVRGARSMAAGVPLAGLRDRGCSPLAPLSLANRG